jgi:Flp pilus assembly protein CpaB
MTYRVRNITIAVALGLVAALLTTFYVTNYQRDVRREEANVKVFVATRDISAGTTGAEVAQKGMLETTEIARRNVVPGAISSPDQVENLVATQPILAGEQVSTRRFATAAERGIVAQLSGTMRAVQVPGDQHQLLAGTLKRGDRIDVVASVKIDSDKEIFATRIVLRDLEVLKPAAGPGDGSVKVASGSSASNLSALLAVTDTQVQKLFYVMKHGEWSFQLRPAIKANDSPEALVWAGSILADGLRGAQLQQLETTGGAR